MKRHGIQHFADEIEQKAVVVERFNRTIKTKLYLYLSNCGTVRLVNVIHDLVNFYNYSRHRIIGMTQADVKKKDEN